MSIIESEETVAWELEDLYRHLLSGPDADYRETWRAFAMNARYQRELESAAMRVVRAHRLPIERVGDVVQEALIVLAERLRRRADLGFQPKYGEQRFLAWLRAVARSHCRRALDRQRSRERCGAELDREWPACHAPTANWRAELADAVASLDEPLREVVEVYRQFGSVEAVGARLGLSTTTAWRRFRAAVRELRLRCRPFTASGRLIGTTTVVEKW
jgi:RNA polymerase sigma factor (sigma-70 family)